MLPAPTSLQRGEAGNGPCRARDRVGSRTIARRTRSRPCSASRRRARDTRRSLCCKRLRKPVAAPRRLPPRSWPHRGVQCPWPPRRGRPGNDQCRSGRGRSHLRPGSASDPWPRSRMHFRRNQRGNWRWHTGRGHRARDHHHRRRAPRRVGGPHPTPCQRTLLGLDQPDPPHPSLPHRPQAGCGERIRMDYSKNAAASESAPTNIHISAMRPLSKR